MVCDGLDEERVEVRTFDNWLRRRVEYEEILREPFDEAQSRLATCPHGYESIEEEESSRWPIPPFGHPNPDWESYLNGTDDIPVCLDCLANEDFLEGFLDVESTRISDKARTIIEAFVTYCLEHIDEGAALGVRVPADTYVRWVYSQRLTEPWYTYSVTWRFIFSFLRSCDHITSFGNDPFDD